MTKLSKEQKAERDSIINALNDTKDALVNAVADYNDALHERWRAVQSALEDYNDNVMRASDWCEGVSQEIQDFINDHSKSWIDGDKGQAVDAWRGQFENHGIDEAEISDPEELDADLEDITDILNSLDEEAA